MIIRLDRNKKIYKHCWMILKNNKSDIIPAASRDCVCSQRTFNPVSIQSLNVPTTIYSVLNCLGYFFFFFSFFFFFYTWSVHCSEFRLSLILNTNPNPSEFVSVLLFTWILARGFWGFCFQRSLFFPFFFSFQVLSLTRLWKMAVPVTVYLLVASKLLLAEVKCDSINFYNIRPPVDGEDFLFFFLSSVIRATALLFVPSQSWLHKG